MKLHQSHLHSAECCVLKQLWSLTRRKSHNSLGSNNDSSCFSSLTAIHHSAGLRLGVIDVLLDLCCVFRDYGKVTISKMAGITQSRNDTIEINLRMEVVIRSLSDSNWFFFMSQIASRIIKPPISIANGAVTKYRSGVPKHSLLEQEVLESAEYKR
jgi:hypothetical protein